MNSANLLDIYYVTLAILIIIYTIIVYFYCSKEGVSTKKMIIYYMGLLCSVIFVIAKYFRLI